MISLGCGWGLSLLIGLSIAFGGCAGFTSREMSEEHVNDSMITAEVTAALAADPRVRAPSLIKVETSDGIVLLTGFADSRLEAEDAAVIARSVRGVKAVRNQIVFRVRPD